MSKITPWMLPLTLPRSQAVKVANDLAKGA